MTDHHTRALLEQALTVLSRAADQRNIGNPEVGVAAFELLEPMRAELAKPVEAITTDMAAKRLCKALRDDLDYAWSWHCNVAMSAYDAGCPHDVANEGAARFMQLLAGVDTRKHFAFEGTQTKSEPTESSYTAVQLAAMVLSDCGISTNHTALHERVAERITRHEEQLIDSLQKLSKPVTDVVVTKNKSGQIVAVTLQDEDGRVMEVIDKSTPTPAWHDAPTCAGLWVRMDAEGNDQSYQVVDAEKWASEVECGERFYGPIPQDGGKS